MCLCVSGNNLRERGSCHLCWHCPKVVHCSGTDALIMYLMDKTELAMSWFISITLCRWRFANEVNNVVARTLSALSSGQAPESSEGKGPARDLAQL